MDLANPRTQGFQTSAANANKSGIVFFPGSAGLYRNGTLAGGLGVSGDGVDQVIDQGVRLPYFKFPRNPTD